MSAITPPSSPKSSTGHGSLDYFAVGITPTGSVFSATVPAIITVWEKQKDGKYIANYISTSSLSAEDLAKITAQMKGLNQGSQPSLKDSPEGKK